MRRSQSPAFDAAVGNLMDEAERLMRYQSAVYDEKTEPFLESHNSSVISKRERQSGTEEAAELALSEIRCSDLITNTSTVSLAPHNLERVIFDSGTQTVPESKDEALQTPMTLCSNVQHGSAQTETSNASCGTQCSRPGIRHVEEYVAETDF